MDDAVGEDAGLTGARAGDDEHRAFGVQDGLPLGRIQLREVLLGRRDGHPSMVSRGRRRLSRGRGRSTLGLTAGGRSVAEPQVSWADGLSPSVRGAFEWAQAVTGTPANVRPQVGTAALLVGIVRSHDGYSEPEAL